ncbi:hypothetical protein GCM10023257_07490 [Streptomyces hyderabadensis]|uniref:Uncharacterized protein n=1 Tax=Streptomyces hyderabadensis TaxID=598549 RepID=A0ABP9HLT9_9ACTN
MIQHRITVQVPPVARPVCAGAPDVVVEAMVSLPPGTGVSERSRTGRGGRGRDRYG